MTGFTPESGRSTPGERTIGHRGCCARPDLNTGGLLDFRLLGDSQGVVHLDAEIADRALELGVAEQYLDRA
jgi:hypothetical protein